MLRRKIGNILLIEDVVKSINMMNSNRVVVKLEGDPSLFEFQNTEKKNRADYFKKMKFEEGDSIILVGAKNDASSVMFYGFDSKKEGYVSAKSYSIYRGKIESVFDAGIFFIVTLKHNDDISKIRVPKKILKNISEGDTVSCLCSSSIRKKCGYCLKKSWTLSDCDTCPERETIRDVVALEIEKEREYYEDKA